MPITSAKQLIDSINRQVPANALILSMEANNRAMVTQSEKQTYTKLMEQYR